MFDFWVLLVLQDQREMLRSSIKREMKNAQFSRNQDTEWAYHRVASYLEDGWRDSSRYWLLRSGFRASAVEVGQIINRLVAGYRYERQDAEAIGAPWLFADDTADLAAFVFYATTEEPMSSVA
jgi:hypothetical protein